MTRDEMACWMALAAVPGVGPVLFRDFCEHFGTPENVFHAAPEERERLFGLVPETVRALRRPGPYLQAALRMAGDLLEAGVGLVTYRDPDYPRGLLDLRDPPPFLYVLGRLSVPGERRFSVAGSTRPSARGGEIAAAAGRELAAAGWTVVSGYAPGVDSAAHAAALDAGGRTVLVLPSGVRRFELRPGFGRFLGQVGGNLVVVSECAPDENWSSRAAVRRDRLIAAMGRALLVVEARPRSGTMVTFRHARELGRPAYVVKYRRAPAGAAGNRLALRAGGVPVESLSALRRIAWAKRLPRSAPAGQGVLF